MSRPSESRPIDRLLNLMTRLRDPERGCPWDLEQDFATIAPHTIEEAYEVADAIDRGDMEELKLELGDLLLQSVYHARMAEEAGHFDFSDVVEAITAKMIRRHPHVFGNEEARSAGSAKGQWERIKAQEKAELAHAKAARGYQQNEAASLLDDVPGSLPGLPARAPRRSTCPLPSRRNGRSALGADLPQRGLRGRRDHRRAKEPSGLGDPLYPGPRALLG